MLLAAACSQTAFGQPGCANQERRWGLRLWTARFSAGAAAVTVTLPWQLFRRDVVTVFPEVSGDLPQRLFLETGGEKVAVENGAALHIFPKVGERVILSLATADGRPLCTWQPPVRVAAHGPPQVEEGFRQFAHELFRNAGEPIRLEVGGKLAGGSAPFRIDGLPAAVIARTGWEVVLRDPLPATGLRTVESQGYSITLPFVEVQLQLPKPSRNGRGTLGIKVLGYDLVKTPGFLPEVFLINNSERTMSVNCGKSYRSDPEWPDGRFISLARQTDGEATALCKVRFHGDGQVSLEARVTERHPIHVLPPGR